MLFGRAGAGMLNMLQDGSAALDDYAATAAKLGVVWTTEDAKKAEELNDAWDMLKGQLLMISVHIGSALAPALLELAEKLTPLIKWVSDFVERNKELIVTVTKAAVAAIALGAGLWGLSAATTGLSMLIWQVHYISATLMALGALVKNTVLVSFMKLGLLPAKALYTLAKPFQYLSDTLKGLGTLVKNTVLVSLMKLGLLPVRQVSELGGSFGKLWNAVKLVYGYAKWLVLGFGELAVLATALAAAILGVYLAFQVLYPYIIEFINSLPTLWQGIKQVVATLPAQIKEAFTLLSGMFQWVMSWVDKTWTYIKAFAWWLKDRFVFIFKDAFNELVAGLSEIAGTFNTAFGAIVNAVKAGEMELAWRIVTVGMELAWLQALKAMEKALDIFIGRITKVFDDLQRSFADWWWSRTKNMAKAFAQIAIGPGGSEEDRLAAFNAIDEDFNKQRAERLKAEKRIKDRRSARSKGSDAEVAALQQEIAELQEKLKDLATEAETKYKASTAPKRGEGPEEPKHLMPSMPKYVPSTELPAALTKGSLEAAQQVEKNRREQAAWEAKMFNEAKKTSDSLKKIEAKAGVGVM